MFLRRARSGAPDRYLDWKVRFFFAGAGLLVLGMVLERRELAAAAVAVLLVGVVLGLVGRWQERRDESPPPPEE